MKKSIFKTLFFICFTGNFLTLSAQEQYPVTDIPLHLLKNANAVVRQYEVIFEVKNIGEAIETEEKVFTVLNQNGAKQSEVYFGYNSLIEIEDIEASVLDASGKVVRNLKRRDIEDYKVPEFLFVNDQRFKVLKLPAHSFPYTIRYRVVKKYKSLMHYPVFEPMENSKMALQHAHFELKMPPGLEARIKEVNLPEGCKKGRYAWEFRNIPALATEPFAPPVEKTLPIILTGPTHFTVEGYKGDMSTWNDFGQFIGHLNAGRQAISETTKATLTKLTASCPDTLCKIQRVYEYMQSMTRYFYVGMGIGGWQPALASTVDQYKYGDCKGLSNYTVSMLQHVGVPARYVLIKAQGYPDNQFPDFPNGYFNHAITCVPLSNDTIWLECTNQMGSWGYMSDFTDNRPALVVTPGGGFLTKTPAYTEKENTVRRDIRVKLALDGSAKVSFNNTFQAIMQETAEQVSYASKEEQKKMVYEWLSINDFVIDSLSFEREKGRLPRVHQKMQLTLPKLASVSGKRLFVPVNLMSQPWKIPTADSTRQFDVQADVRGYSEENTTYLELPEGYRAEGEVAPIEAKSVFGQFNMTITKEEGRVVVHRKLVVNSRVQPKERYAEWIEFMKAVNKADKTKLVLLKPT
jgi:hypothetical protein